MTPVAPPPIAVPAGPGPASDPCPLVISFACGDAYYHEAAVRLRGDCERLGLAHDIVALAPAPGDTWLTICRRKIPFYLEMMRKHRRPLLWLDVDCRLLRAPRIAAGDVDLAGFLRMFQRLPAFDPLASPRFFWPGALLFNHTPRTVRFLEELAALEQGSPLEATDDWFLQEAWVRAGGGLSVLVLRPELATTDPPAAGAEAADGPCFLVGVSGNVGVFRGRAEQHEVELHTPRRRKAVLLREAQEAFKARKPAELLTFLQAAFACDPTDEPLAYRIARTLRKQQRMDEALLFLRRFAAGGPVNHARRFQADSELDAGDAGRAERIAGDLLAKGSPDDRAWARSRLLRIGLEQRARSLGLAAEQRPALWWMEGPYPGNFGDILNPYVVEKLSGVPPRHASSGARLLAIGSVARLAEAGTTVWGAGTARLADRLDPAADWRAVRGPLTRRQVLAAGGSCPEVYGDPACLLPRLYTPRPAPRRRPLGVVLHHVHDDQLTVGDDVALISVRRGSYADIEAFIDELHACERILSSSLHGLIVSHAYGIPARWCTVPDAAEAIRGDGTKFHDYLLAVGLEPEPPLALPRGTCVTRDLAAAADQLPRRPIDLAALLAAAPFALRAAPPA